jgi:5,10-methylene-tetrahydrofolate dehydrogenase/methenyl tetrahydrofolate cyclohydrolase
LKQKLSGNKTRSVGDFAFSECSRLPRHIPVPRGGGPTTIAMLMANSDRDVDLCHG